MRGKKRGMTSRATRDDRPTEQAAVPHLAPPPKLRRRPAVVAAAVAAACLGGALAAWAWTATTDTLEVIAATNTIERGAVIQAEDLQTVRITGDPALHTVPASAIETMVGKRAAYDIVGGGLLTPDAATSDNLPPAGKSIVGIALTPAQSPALSLRNGDLVRVVLTPGEGGEAASDSPAFTAAEVVGTHVDETTGGTVVDVLVPYADAGVLAARAATGNVALVLDSGER